MLGNEELAICNTGTAHALMASSCLAYLLQLSQDELDNSVYSVFPLASYAANFWYIHYELSHEDSSIKSQLSSFLQLNSNPFLNWVRLHDIDNFGWTGLSKSYSDNGHPLYYSILLCQEEIVKQLLENGADFNAQGGKYGNALQAASYSGISETAWKMEQVSMPKVDIMEMHCKLHHTVKL